LELADLQFEILTQELKRRLLEESIPRILKCLDYLSENEIWQSPNTNSNSIGNLVLHLEGNVTQWFIAPFQGLPDKRNRRLEFLPQQHIPKEVLCEKLNQLSKKITTTIQLLNKEKLVENYTVQGFQENGLSMVIHVIEHFSYHVGQITYQTKALKNIDIGYYSGVDLE
jgi:uncharacterized damage-inducible protein DinB